uniref:Putative glycosyltransferase n=1 Tax=viral metagenome TaxID=1070528 RepID=A0A6M3LAL1_9ZZZZ
MISNNFKEMAVLCKENDVFVNPIIDYLRQSYGDSVRVYKQGDCSMDELFELLSKVDLAWLEWCSDWSGAITAGDKYCKLMMRLHSYEAFNMSHKNQGVVQNVNWNQIDDLIVVNPSVIEVMNIIRNHFYSDAKMSNQPINIDSIRPTIDPTKINFIPIGVDTKKFRIANGKPKTKKIAWVGYINYKKNFQLALYAFMELLKKDPEYEFHIAGLFQDPRDRIYFDWLTRDMPKNFDKDACIFYHGWVDPSHLNEWLEDKTYIISSSLFEAAHTGIAESMSSGLIPLIHHWFGADNVYPKEFFWNDISQFIELVESIQKLNEVELNNLRKQLRQSIIEKNGIDITMPKIKNLVDSHLFEEELILYFKDGVALPDVKFDLSFQKIILERRGKLK